MTFQDENVSLPPPSPAENQSLPPSFPAEGGSLPPSFPAPLSEPSSQRRTGRWRVITLTLVTLLILGVLAGGSLYVLGARGIGPLAAVLHPTPTYQGPQVGNWAAFTDQPSLTFTFQVTPDRQAINNVTVHFDALMCQFLQVNGRISDTENLWHLDGQKIPDVKVVHADPIRGSSEFIFRGSFDITGKQASGKWDFNLISVSTGEPYTICTGTWKASGQ